MTLYCKNCRQKLTEPLWRDQGEYFVTCFHCGAKNVIEAIVQVVGWRP